MSKLRFLSRTDVARALPMKAAVEGMKQAYAQLSAGEANMPLRARVPAENEGVALVMPAYLPRSQSLALKVVTVFPENVTQNLPIIHALVLALDAESGQPLALMEGGSLTAIRTGAGSGAATDALARNDASSVAIIGSGVQAKTQLEAVCAVRPIQRVWVYSPTPENAERFAHEMAGANDVPGTIHVASSPDEAIAAADIVCTATISATPVFDGSQLRPGMHINAVGSYRPDMREVDATTLQRSLIVVDSREAVMAEAGELIQALQAGELPPDAIHAELGEILNGEKAGRTDDAQITYFKSVGVAAQDAIAAQIVLHHAQDQDIGTLLEL